MPTYDYVCDGCEHAFESFQSMSAKPHRKCPECGKSKLRRLIGTGAGVIFKGSGFYETDYRSESYKKSAEADKPKTDSDSKSGDSKSSDNKSGEGKAGKADTKPAAKSKSSDGGKKGGGGATKK